MHRSSPLLGTRARYQHLAFSHGLLTGRFHARRLFAEQCNELSRVKIRSWMVPEPAATGDLMELFSSFDIMRLLRRDAREELQYSVVRSSVAAGSPASRRA
jgi:hypothetical protein